MLESTMISAISSPKDLMPIPSSERSGIKIGTRFGKHWPSEPMGCMSFSLLIGLVITDERYSFRWVECQFEALKRCPGSSYHLDQCLKSLPRNLDQTYERMLDSIEKESVEEARR